YVRGNRRVVRALGALLRLCDRAIQRIALASGGPQAWQAQPLRDLRRLVHAVVRAEREHPPPGADGLVEEREELAERAVQPQQVVELLAAERAVRVADAVRLGERDGEEVRAAVSAQPEDRKSTRLNSSH